MSLFSYKGKGVFHFHIPKTGGVSIIRALQDAGAKKIFEGKDDETGVRRGHLHLADVARKFPEYSGFPQFTIIRNPWQRLCSEYVWKKGTPIFNHKFNKWVYNRLSKYKRNNYLDDNHFRPQIEFVSPDVKVFVADYTNFAQDWLCEYFNEQFHFEKLNQAIKYEYPDIDEILDMRSKTIFYDVYREDIDFYNKEYNKYKELS